MVPYFRLKSDLDLSSVILGITARSTSEDYAFIFEVIMQSLNTGEGVKLLRTIDCLASFVQHPHHITGRALMFENWASIVLSASKIIRNTSDISHIDKAFDLITLVAKDKVLKDFYVAFYSFESTRILNDGLGLFARDKYYPGWVLLRKDLSIIICPHATPKGRNDWSDTALLWVHLYPIRHLYGQPEERR